MPSNRLKHSWRKPLLALTNPGMYLVYKYNQYKRQQQEHNKKKVTEKELQHLNHKIDKLLVKLGENEADIDISEEEECVVCLCAKATMQTFPCGHRVVCRKCFVKTIQVAVSQRCLPLKCVVCRSRILKLKQSGDEPLTPQPTHKPYCPSPSGKVPKTSFRQLFGGGARQQAVARQHSSPIATKLMQPLLIYPSNNDPHQHLAFMEDVLPSPVHHHKHSHSASLAKYQPASLRHHNITMTDLDMVPQQINTESMTSSSSAHASPVIASSIRRDFMQSFVLSPRVQRCSHASRHIHPSPRPASLPRSTTKHQV